MEKIPVRKIIGDQKEPELSGSFSIRELPDILAGNDLVQEFHRHDFFYILALNKGTGYHEIDFTEFPVSDGSIFFMRPGQVHRLVLQAGSTGYLLQFSNDFYYPHDTKSTQLLRKAISIQHYTPVEGMCQKLLAAVTAILREYDAREEGYIEVIKAQLSIFFITLVRNDKTLFNRVNHYAQERLEEFRLLLDLHILNHRQVSEYAAMMNLSTYQVNAITRLLLDKTCSELIHERVILEAKRYLLATSGKVTAIAAALGYEDASYFVRFFKKQTGHSPEAFRVNFS